MKMATWSINDGLLQASSVACVNCMGARPYVERICGVSMVEDTSSSFCSSFFILFWRINPPYVQIQYRDATLVNIMPLGTVLYL